jgi:hypothetical protein
MEPSSRRSTFTRVSTKSTFLNGGNDMHAPSPEHRSAFYSGADPDHV